MKTGHKSLEVKMSEATVECPAEENMLSGLEKLPKKKNPKVAKKRQANGKTPGAKLESPAVAKSKQKLKVLVGKKTTNLKPKPPVEENMINPTLALPAGEKTSKPSPRLPVTKKCKKNLATAGPKLPKKKNPKVAKKRQANGKAPGAKLESPAVAKSKQKLKVLVGKKTTNLKLKPPVEKNMINPTLALPAGEKTSKPSPKLPVTKKCKKNLATAGRKTQKTNTGIKVNKMGKTKTPIKFVVHLLALFSLEDPDVKKVMDLLFKADDVKVHRKFFVSCKNKAAAENFQSELRDYDPYGKKFYILPYNPSFNSETQKNKRHIKFFVSCKNKAAAENFQSELRDYDPYGKKLYILPYNPSFNSETQKNKRHMLYVVSLPRNTADKDLQNSFTKAKSVHITTFPKGKKLVRMGHICFDTSIDAKDALAIKNRRINGKYVQVTARKSAAMKRPFAQIVSSLPSKKAKLIVDKKTEDDADDHDNMLSSDQEDCGEDGESHDSDVNEKKEEDDESQNYEDGDRNDEEVDLDNET